MERRTKIISTLGPASWSKEVIARLLHMGVDAFRINFAHGDPERWRSVIKIVRTLSQQNERLVPIIGDLQGPTIRLGDVEPYFIKKGNMVKVVKADKGGKGELPVPSEKFFEALDEGDIILVEGGKLRFRVEGVGYEEAKAEALNDGEIRGRKTVTLQGKELDFPSLTNKDLEDVKFCVEQDLDFISLSFVRKPDDILTLRDLLEELDATNVKIIAKIETRSAVDNLKGIVNHADVILVARGDLGLYFNLEEIPVIQEEILNECLKQGKPSIIATQLLESMLNSPLPSRAEVVDIMTAVRQGVDALLLAGETAIGAYPVECVKWLKRIIREAERGRRAMVKEEEGQSLYDKFARGVCLLADSIGAKIVAYTRTGKTASRIARYRPNSPIYAFTPYQKVARQLNLLWGVNPFILQKEGVEDVYNACIKFLRSAGLLSYGDIVVFIRGLRPRATDFMRIEIIR